MGRKAFTVTELLVLMGAVAVLGVMVIPALGSARDAERYNACVERERQLALGCATYVVDCDFYFPTNSPDGWCLPPGSTDGPVYPKNFAFGRLPGRDPEHDDGRTGMNAAYTSMAHWCNKIYPYVPHPEMYRCEVRESLVGPMHGPGELWDLPGWWIGSVACDYGLNSSVNSTVETGVVYQPFFYMRQSALTHPAETILYGHANSGDRHVPQFTKQCATDEAIAQWPAIYPHYWAGERPGGVNGFIFGDFSVRGLTLEDVQTGADALFAR